MHVYDLFCFFIYVSPPLFLFTLCTVFFLISLYNQVPFILFVYTLLHIFLSILDRLLLNDVLMFMLGLKKTMDLLAMANSVHWYGHVLRREDGHVLRRALDFEVEGQRKKWRP